MNNKVEKLMKEIENNSKIKIWKEFKFPNKIPLNIRLKDILEKDVDERYYLPDDKLEKLFDVYMSRNSEPFIVASRGKNPDNPSDRTTGSPTEQRLEPNFSGCTNTLTSVQKDNYVAEPRVKNVGNIYPSNGQNGNIYDVGGISPTINAGIGVKGNGIGSNNAPKVIIPEPIVCEERRDEGIRLFKDDCVGTLRTIDACGDKRVIESDENIRWRIRKLTPKECWRLMGFSDEDHDKAAQYVSASSLYKQAGNSICTCCLIAIFNALFLHDYSSSYANKLVDYNS